MFTYYPHVQYIDGSNLYQYVVSIPTSAIDPMGYFVSLAGNQDSKDVSQDTPLGVLMENQKSKEGTKKKSACDEWREQPEPKDCNESIFLIGECAKCCTEVFKDKVIGGSWPHKWPGWWTWYGGCRNSCAATGGKNGPELPGPGTIQPESPRSTK